MPRGRGSLDHWPEPRPTQRGWGQWMIDRMTDAANLQYQYGDSEKLKIRYEAHTLYSERTSHWHALFTEVLDIVPGEQVVDVGCGPGGIHVQLSRAGAQVTGIDASPGMVAEARAQAEQEGLNVQVRVGDAERLPFADGQFDAALCCHMLYHVPDIRAALTELRRVLRRGGRVLISTNAADHCARLNDLHAQAARELGFVPVVGDLAGGGRFSLSNLPLVQSVFPNVQLHELPNAFIWPTVESALRYYASGRIDAIQRVADETGHRELLLERMRELIGEIVAREGVFRVPKDAGYFLATVP
ncbi:MAG: class I SAM-dependent methyltransferase [Chloroflexi bacterium]|nr:class I SAM-dependent methyltransferase [Chloroflexota bacterium]